LYNDVYLCKLKQQLACKVITELWRRGIKETGQFITVKATWQL